MTHQFPTLKLFQGTHQDLGCRILEEHKESNVFEKGSPFFSYLRGEEREKPRAAASGENRGKEKPHMSPLINKWHILQGLGTSNNKDQLILKMLSMWTSKEFSLIPLVFEDETGKNSGAILEWCAACHTRVFAFSETQRCASTKIIID